MKVFIKSIFNFFVKPTIKINVGSGGIYENGWIGTDIETLNLLNEDHWKKYNSKYKITAILGEHVWEHLTIEQGLLAAKNCFDYIEDGGFVRVAVPDGYNPSPDYINYVKPGGYGPGADDHKVLYNYHTFKDVFEKAGFKVKLLEYFDEKGNFYFNSWDETLGMIKRSKRFDTRNDGNKLGYTSIILDAVKN